jgi:two-component system chemotaxis response regulator CheB
LGHDIIVIGGSKGARPALIEIASNLPRGLPAAVFIVVHLPVAPESNLPEALRSAGALPAAFAADGEPIFQGRIYVAPANRHLSVDPGRIRLLHGPPERGHRPAIDPVFRSAGQSYGRRVVGVVMSGLLKDGTEGLAAIKNRGGVAVVQDPEDAPEPSMPLNALARVEVNHCVPAQALAPLLVKLAHEPLPAESEGPREGWSARPRAPAISPDR